MPATRRALPMAGAVLALGLIGALAGAGTLAALSATSASAGNAFGAGTIHLTDDDAGASVVSLSAAQPGTVSTGCVGVSSAGTLDSSVRLYGASAGALVPHLALTITRGTQGSPAFPSCNGFTADATNYLSAGPGVVYSGPLAAYPASAAAGIVDPPIGPPEVWSPGEARAYRIAVTLGSAAAAQGLSATASLTWQGRSR